MCVGGCLPSSGPTEDSGITSGVGTQCTVRPSPADVQPQYLTTHWAIPRHRAPANHDKFPPACGVTEDTVSTLATSRSEGRLREMIFLRAHFTRTNCTTKNTS